MADNKKKIILQFKKLVIVTLISLALTLAYAITTKVLFPNFIKAYAITAIIGILLFAFYYGMLILSVIYAYKTSRILHRSGNLKVNPGLILILLISRIKEDWKELKEK